MCKVIFVLWLGLIGISRVTEPMPEVNHTVEVNENTVVDIEDEDYEITDWKVEDFTFQYTIRNRD